MARTTVRTSLDLPVSLHSRLHEAAARKGCSAGQMILESIEQAVKQATPEQPRRRLNLAPALVPVSGRKSFCLTNDEIYRLLERS